MAFLWGQRVTVAHGNSNKLHHKWKQAAGTGWEEGTKNQANTQKGEQGFLVLGAESYPIMSSQNHILELDT